MFDISIYIRILNIGAAVCLRLLPSFDIILHTFYLVACLIIDLIYLSFFCCERWW